MNRQSWTSILPLLVLSSIAAPVTGQSAPAPCVVRIDEPQDEQEVGFAIHVRGTAELAPGQHLWVFSRPESHHTIGKWWPQDEAVFIGDKGRWRSIARLGSPSNVGEFFQVAVAPFAEREHQVLVSHLRHGYDTGIFESIEMPTLACPPKFLAVRKTSHIEPGQEPCPEKCCKICP